MKLLAAILTAWLLLATPSAARAQTSQPLPDNGLLGNNCHVSEQSNSPIRLGV
jgi:hypothetical protein